VPLIRLGRKPLNVVDAVDSGHKNRSGPRHALRGPPSTGGNAPSGAHVGEQGAEDEPPDDAGLERSRFGPWSNLWGEVRIGCAARYRGWRGIVASVDRVIRARIILHLLLNNGRHQFLLGPHRSWRAFVQVVAHPPHGVCDVLIYRNGVLLSAHR